MDVEFFLSAFCILIIFSLLLSLVFLKPVRNKEIIAKVTDSKSDLARLTTVVVFFILSAIVVGVSLRFDGPVAKVLLFSTYGVFLIGFLTPGNEE